MTNYDIIFIHPPRNFEYLETNLKVRSTYLLMPMGLFGLADLLEREGFSCKIYNYPLEKKLNPNFSIIKTLRQLDFKIIGVDLHWALHSAGAIDLLKIIKKAFPNCFTLLGGFTATYYAHEIMKKYDFIDGIIQSDAEIPIIQLLKSNLKNLETVQNLIYRSNGKIYDNKITFLADEIDSLNFSKLKYLEHWKEYIEYNYNVMHLPWPVEMARGCKFNCVNCAGSYITCVKIYKRRNVIFRSPNRVVDDIKEFLELSPIKGVFYGHGVYPDTEKYFLEIQKLIQEEKLDLHCDLEIWRLPISKKFFIDFSKTYNLRKSLLWFSVRSFYEYYRNKFTKYFGKFDNSFKFTNKDLENLIKITQSCNIPLRFFWDAGNPFETGFDLFMNIMNALKVIIKNFSKKYKVGMWSEPIIITPACPVELFRKYFGVKMYVDNFEDYVELNRKSKMNLPPIDLKVNYRTQYLTSAGINLTNKLMFLLNILSLIRS